MRVLTYGIAIAALAVGAALPAAAEGAETAYRAGRFTPVQPVRLHDAPVGSGASARVALDGQVPADVTAVVLNLTLSGTSATQVTVHSAGTARTGAVAHLRADETRTAQVTVGIAEVSGVDIHNSAGRTDVVADLVGYYRSGAGAGFHGVTPVRVADVRPIAEGGTHAVDFSAHVPETAVAVTFTLTAAASETSRLTAWPTGGTRPSATTLHLAENESRSNLVTVALGDNRSVNIHNAAGSARALVDVLGYYTETGGGAFRARTPVHEYDSRKPYPSGMPGLPLPPNSRASFSLVGSVPEGVTGILLGVTGINPTADTYLTAWTNARAPRPAVAAVSIPAHETVSNSLVLGMREGDLATVYNSAGRTHVTVDLLGYFVAEVS